MALAGPGDVCPAGRNAGRDVPAAGHPFRGFVQGRAPEPVIWEGWLGEFKDILRRLYWSSAVVHLETEFEPDRRFEWLSTQAALDRMRRDDPEPVQEWTRTVRESPPSPSS